MSINGRPDLFRVDAAFVIHLRGQLRDVFKPPSENVCEAHSPRRKVTLHYLLYCMSGMSHVMHSTIWPSCGRKYLKTADNL